MVKPILKFTLPLIIIALSIVGAGYLRATKPALTPKAPVEKVWPVSAIEAAPSDIQPELRVFGEIVAGREVEMRPLVAGRVVEAGPDFVEGGVLRRGDLLVAIDPFDYNAKVTDRTAALAEARAKQKRRPAPRRWGRIGDGQTDRQACPALDHRRPVDRRGGIPPGDEAGAHTEGAG